MAQDPASIFRLDDRVALVTGASKGIGAAMARGLAEFGAKVVVCSRKQEAVDAVVAEFRADALEATGIAANVGNIDDIEALVDKTVDIYGGLDIIVNNAAANPVFRPLQNTDQRAFDKIVDVNLKGPFELCRKAYPLLKRRGGGSIINISSIGGLTPEAGIGIYSVSKAGIISLTKSMAQDWGADNIRVDAICPGLIRTRFSEVRWDAPGSPRISRVSRFTWRPTPRLIVPAVSTWSMAATPRAERSARHDLTGKHPTTTRTRGTLTGRVSRSQPHEWKIK